MATASLSIKTTTDMANKISFDFDSTLSEKWVQAIAALLIPVTEVWIVTARAPGSHNRDLIKIAFDLGIPEERIVFTDGAYKWSVLKHYGIEVHFDDMEDEILEINNQTDCKGVLVGLKDTQELWYLFSKTQENKE